MGERTDGILYKLSRFIVNKRNLFFFLFTLISIFSVFSMNWTKVENDITAYLNEDTKTRVGLALMEEEFTTFGTAQVMISHIDFATALELSEQVSQIEGVKSLEFEQNEDHYKDAAALYAITFDGTDTDESVLLAMKNVRLAVDGYDVSIKTEIGVSSADTLAEEMNVIIVIAVMIIITVLLFTSKSYAEIPVLLITFGVAALLNKGSNFLFGEISFVSDSVAVVLQLALAIDYAIILCHRFSEECNHHDSKEACIVALSKAMIEISSSSLTTISGLLALSFMNFQLGADLSKVLIKSILISLVCVFTLMPGLLVLFSKKIEKTQHRNFVPSIVLLGKLSIKTRYIILPIFLGITVIAAIFSSRTNYLFSVDEIRAANLSEVQIQADRITAQFGGTNGIALIIPSGNYEKEGEVIAELETYPEIDQIVSLANTEALDDYMLTDELTAREFSELMDLDYEEAKLLYATYAIHDENYAKLINRTEEEKMPLIDVILFLDDMQSDGYITLDGSLEEDLTSQSKEIRDGQKQLESDDYTRMVIALNLPQESEETFAFLDTLYQVVGKYYDEVHLVGNPTSNADLSSTFSRDNLMISILSALFVIMVLLVTFGSVAIPIFLILIIQSAIFINFAIPYLYGTGLFFIGYLVVSSIQMGANVDYAIVITNRYMELRKTLDNKNAMIRALDESFATIVTSGTILAAAGVVIQHVTTDGTIATIGECIGRGTIISMILVMFVLPQILYLGTGLIDRSTFTMKFQRNQIKQKVEQGTACLLAFILVTHAVTIPSFAEEQAVVVEIEISNVEEFLEFAKSCRLDSFSKNKKVVLTTDLDVSDTDFEDIPIFLGTFDGGGHTIQGLDESLHKDYQGLFRYLEEGATVYQLNVKGSFQTEHNYIGGVVGENRGTIKNCTFEGVVNGKEYVGGIAGKNYGRVMNCTVSGGVFGEGKVGGIVGENEGTILRCKNLAEINTDISGITFDLESELLSTIKSDNETITIMDIGGITGENIGLIQNSQNEGTIGYEHVGYNIGGIAGKQSGYISSCMNEGMVFGRKEVGGIVGQFEPYISTTYSKSKLEELREELDVLSDLTSDFSDTAKNSNSLISTEISILNNHIDDSRLHTENLINQTETLLTENVDTINEISVTVAEVLDDLVPITSGLDDIAMDLGDAFSSLESSANRFGDALEELEDLGDISDDINESLVFARGQLSNAIEEIRLASSLVVDGSSILEIYGNLQALMEHVTNASDSLILAVEEMETILFYASEIMPTLGDSNTDLQKALERLSEGFNSASDASQSLDMTVSDLFFLIDDLSQKDEVKFTTTNEIYDHTKDLLSESLDQVSDEIDRINDTVSRSVDTLVDDFDQINQQLNTVLTLLIELIQDVSSFKDQKIFQVDDISEEEIADIIAGKVLECRNTGKIEGDINVGGIAGAMSFEYLFDMEDDYKIESDQTKITTRSGIAVIQDSKNTGEISSKKDGVGGIVGLQDFGIVLHATSATSIESTDGSYVGGIVGNSSAVVKDCSAKGDLIGTRYVGGITGSGYYMIENNSLVTIEATEGNIGGITGYLEEEGKLETNYFVSEDLGGLDGISYAEKAEPISYKMLIDSEGVSEIFDEMKLSFYVDGELFDWKMVDFGTKMEENLLPELEDRKGYYGKWETINFDQINSDQKVYAEYLPMVTTLASEEKEGVLALVLVDGNFTDQETLLVEELDDYQYQIKVEGVRSQIDKIRFLNPFQHTQIQMMQHGVWTTIDVVEDGKYLVFEPAVGLEDEIQFRVIEEKRLFKKFFENLEF